MTPGSPSGQTWRRRKGDSKHPKRWVGVLMVLVVLLFLIFSRHGLLHLYRLQSEQRRIEVEIASLQERAAELRQEVASLESDLTYIERLAREKYRMVKRGEKVFRVMPDRRQPGGNEGEKVPE